MTYCDVFSSALSDVLERFERGEIALETEAELRGWLFAGCARELEERQHERPFPIHAEKFLDDGRADLTLGPRNEVAIELKLEPSKDGEGSIFLRKTGGRHSIEGDLEKLRDYSRQGACGHFVMVELDDGSSEDYYWPSWTGEIGLPPEEWEERAGCAIVHHEVRPVR